MTFVSGNLDYEIIPLISAMNYSELVSTFSSCVGHKPYEDCYISFNCKLGKFRRIVSLISKAEDEIISKDLPYEIDLDVITGTKYPKGMVSLILLVKYDTERDGSTYFSGKLAALDIITKHFLKVVDRAVISEEFKKLVCTQVGYSRFYRIVGLEEACISIAEKNNRT